MRTRLLLLLALLAIALPGYAKTLRWASAAEFGSMDAHAQASQAASWIHSQVFDTLVGRDKQLNLVPRLAVSWERIDDTTWRFKLRQGVRFHDGTPLTADDVVFSFERAQQPTSGWRAFAIAVGNPRRIDDLTVEFVQDRPNPILVEHASTIFIMSKAWSEKNSVSRPLDFKAKEDTYATRNANGTGPYALRLREPDVKTILRNPDYWGTIEGNVTEIVFLPIKSDATRVAALMSGEVDFTTDPPLQDVDRLKKSAGITVLETEENRISFIGMDQSHDELSTSNIRSRNPFKDRRVRQALYQAIDVEAIRSKILRGLGKPTGGMTPSPAASNAEHERRLPFDPDVAKKLLADAGYADGFDFALDCPTYREPLCTALAGMWSRIGVKVTPLILPYAVMDQKMQNGQSNAYSLAWGGSITDAQWVLTPVMHSKQADGRGDINHGRYVDAKLDRLIDQAAVEMNADKRRVLIANALKTHNEEIHYLPLYRPVIAWAMRSNVKAVIRANATPLMEWTRID